jgi:rubrerythrin
MLKRYAAFGFVFALAVFVAASFSLQPAVAQDRETLDKATQNALNEALDDEYKAHAFYEAVLAKFGPTMPFSNIINSEARHADMVKDLMDGYNVTIPENKWTGKVPAPATVKEACQQAVAAEKANVGLYDRLLADVKAEDIREIFTYLQDASKEHHLRAFERCVARDGEWRHGRGWGQGHNNRWHHRGGGGGGGGR